MDHKTLRSCGDLPLGLIVTPLGCLTLLCCRRDDDALNDDGRMNDGRLNDGAAVANTTATTTTTSTQWNGREQCIYPCQLSITYNGLDVTIRAAHPSGIFTTSSSVLSESSEKPNAPT